MCIYFNSHSQQFSFDIYFTDAIGNKDTITFGYDSLATDSIDISFGEIDLIGIPFDTTLDVRISNYLYNPATYQTKKQIVHANCPYTNLQTIEIFTNHWPVTAQWDSTLFSDSCRTGSLFTSIHPGGWWDTGSPSDLWRQVCNSSDSVTFTSNNAGIPTYSYLNTNGDTISLFWQIFGDEGILSTSITEQDIQEIINIFPNPVSDKLNIAAHDRFGKITSVEISDLTGKRFAIYKGTDCNVAHLSSGIYFITVTNKHGHKLTSRFVKN
jgi:hypothetical protein